MTLDKELSNLNDELIGDIILLKIDEQMQVSTLNALSDMFFMRHQLAQLSSDEKEPIYESLCRLRFEEIAIALSHKYAKATTINEKIEILERLEYISQLLRYENDEQALAESQKLDGLSDLNEIQYYYE